MFCDYFTIFFRLLMPACLKVLCIIISFWMLSFARLKETVRLCMMLRRNLHIIFLC